VFLHENGTEPDFSSGILVSVGTTTNLEISQTNYKRLRYQKKNNYSMKFSSSVILAGCFSLPYSNCTETVTDEADLASDTAKRTFKRFTKYTQDKCVLMCLNDEFFRNTGVDLPEIQPINNLTLQIANDVFLSQSYLNSSLIYGCKEKCPIECNSVNYEVRSSSAAYPSESYKRLLEIYFNSSLSFKPNNSRFVNLTEHEDKILAVNIFYKVDHFVLV